MAILLPNPFHPMALQKSSPLAVLLLCTSVVGLPARAGSTTVDVSELTASEAVRQMCAGTLSSEQLVSAYIARAKANTNLNAFITLDDAGALAAARTADVARKRGGECKTLGGLPIVIKDNIQVRGLPATAGTPALKAFVPAADAPVVAKLRAAGAIILGKTNMHELAFGVSGYNPAYQTGLEVGVRNAYDPSRIAGGSSSGNAAALGARMAPASLGTDTGGSVRIPCAFNGCAALRPTMGRYSQQGIAPISHTRDTAGPMALSMADLVLLDRVIAGGRPIKPAELKHVRLGVVPAFYANVDAETRLTTDDALAKLRAAGATLVDVNMPGLMELNGAVGFPVALYEAHDDIQAYLAKYRTGIDMATLTSKIASADVKDTFDGLVVPRKLPAANGGVIDAKPPYDNAIRVARPALQALYRDTFAKNRLDALVFPTVPRVALAAAPDASSPMNFASLIQNTDPASNAGIPGVQLPSGLGGMTGLPVGLELDGPVGSDRKLLAIGLAVESVLGRLPAPKAR